MIGIPGPGDQFGDYRIIREIGRGGMGIVYEAVELSLQRSVALKVVMPGVADLEDFQGRFAREAAVLARIRSRHIVPIHSFGQSDGLVYFAADYFPDGDLQRRVAASGPLPRLDALRIVGQVSEALEDAHREGVIHRDVKPSNILLWQRGSGVMAYLCDFGIALAGDTQQTRTGAVIGSLAYMAPERHLGDAADERSDVYAVGCVLWAALSGHAPYIGTDFQVMNAHISAPIPQLEAVDELDERINVFLRDAMSKDRETRVPDAATLGERVNALAHDAAVMAPSAAQVSSPAVEGMPSYVAPDLHPLDDDGRGFTIRWDRSELPGLVEGNPPAPVSEVAPDPVLAREPITDGDVPKRSDAVDLENAELCGETDDELVMSVPPPAYDDEPPELEEEPEAPPIEDAAPVVTEAPTPEVSPTEPAAPDDAGDEIPDAPALLVDPPVAEEAPVIVEVPAAPVGPAADARKDEGLTVVPTAAPPDVVRPARVWRGRGRVLAAGAAALVLLTGLTVAAIAITGDHGSADAGAKAGTKPKDAVAASMPAGKWEVVQRVTKTDVGDDQGLFQRVLGDTDKDSFSLASCTEASECRGQIHAFGVFATYAWNGKTLTVHRSGTGTVPGPCLYKGTDQVIKGGKQSSTTTVGPVILVPTSHDKDGRPTHLVGTGTSYVVYVHNKLCTMAKTQYSLTDRWTLTPVSGTGAD